MHFRSLLSESLVGILYLYIELSLNVFFQSIFILMNLCFQMTKWVINGKNCTKINLIEEMPSPCIPGMVLIYAPHTIIICKAISIRKWRKCGRDYVHGCLMPIICPLYRGHKALINIYHNMLYRVQLTMGGNRLVDVLLVNAYKRKNISTIFKRERVQ